MSDINDTGIPLEEAAAFFLMIKQGSDRKPGTPLSKGTVGKVLLGGTALMGTAALAGHLAPGSSEARTQVKKELHDPRLYSNLRGMVSGESKEERRGAHKTLDQSKEHSIGSAMREGFTRGGKKEKTAGAVWAHTVLPGTEHYHSDRLLETLRNLPSKCYSPELLEKIGSAHKEEHEKGKERAHASLSAKFETEKHTRRERGGDVLGRLAGAAMGGVAGKLTGGTALSTLGGAALGQHLGGATGKALGQAADSKAFRKHEKMASVLFKLALEGGDVEEYLAQEQAGAAAQEQAEGDFYRQKYEQAQQAMQQAAAQTQQLQQQVQEAQAQAQQAQASIDATNQQAQQTQQMAMQNVQMAQSAATAAMQRTLATSSELIKQTQLAAEQRDSSQAVKQQLLQLATSLPGPATTQESAAQDVSTQQQNQAAAEQQAMQQAQGEQEGQQGPAAPSPSQGGQPQAQAGGQPGPSPGGGEAGPEDQGSGGASPEQGSPQPATEMAQKAASAMNMALGGLAGAGVGGALGYQQAHADTGALRGKVDELTDKANKSFAESLNLAQAKSRLALQEWAGEHPTASTLMGAGMGAMGGIAGGGARGDSLQKLFSGKRAGG